jgi:hypothetical protein
MSSDSMVRLDAAGRRRSGSPRAGCCGCGRCCREPPHFHAQYGEHVAQIELGTLRVLHGSLPSRALRLVEEWAQLHESELAENWRLAQALEPLAAIDPLA